MKIALIGDIHANLPALEVVLAHAREQEIDTIWSVGDLVGYGAFPDQVVKFFRRKEILSIIGNYDLQVLKFKQKKDKWRKKKRPEKYLAFRWTHQQLSKLSRKYLRFLSKEIRMKVKGHRILLTHGSPASNEEHLAPDTPEKRLRKLAQIAKSNLIICGHSHRPFARRVDDTWFINPGSVGRPDDGDPRASYAILKIASQKEIEVEHYRLEYDVERIVAAIREHDLPEAFAQMFLQGRDLDTILQGK